VDEQLAATVGAAAVQVSVTVGVMVGGAEQHSTVTGGGQLTTGGGAVTTMVSLHVAWLPAWSVAVQMTVMPLFE
jgi:hypothetical protein